MNQPMDKFVPDRMHGCTEAKLDDWFRRNFGDEPTLFERRAFEELKEITSLRHRLAK